MTTPAACFLLHTLGFMGFPRGRPMAAIPWRTAYCPIDLPRSLPLSTGGGGGPLAGCTERDKELRCPRLVSEWGRHLPRVWLFCLYSQNPTNPKRAPGVNAYVPGATLLLPLRPQRASVPDGGSMMISLRHLVSYSSMGVVAVRCAAGCTCAPRLIDASWGGRYGTVPYQSGRNMSVHLTHELIANVTDARLDCLVSLRVVRQTSSGGHRFVLNEVTLQATTHPAATHGRPPSV